MIRSLRIKNFRLFRDIAIDSLSRVNLIVGKNNSGKSTFLEAVRLYASNVSASVLLNLTETRQETWESEGRVSQHDPYDSYLRHIFFGHQLPRADEEGIRLEDEYAGVHYHLTTAAFIDRRDPDGTLRRERVHLSDSDDEDEDVDFSLVVERGDQVRRIFPLEGFGNHRHRRYAPRREVEPRFALCSVPTENMSNRRVAALWDLTSLTEEEEDVIEALQIIDPQVRGVSFVEDVTRHLRGRSSRYERIPIVKLEGLSEPLPLKSMGDGMTRLFHILVALVNAKGGVLLVDEFENGLHWSVQPTVWKVVFEVATKLDVQVFATTHSRDCVDGFDQAWNENPNMGAFFRLESHEAGVSVRSYTSETLTDSIDMNVEVR
jgi:ABC-type branched-subunit amino acid transport system ATPase component